MKIERNKITAIIGPSGCGKSTFLKSLNLLVNEENSFRGTGEILFKDKNINTMGREEIREKIGMVFQHPTAFPFSVYKNLIYAPIYYGVKDKNDLDKIVEDKLRMAGIYNEIKDNLNMVATKLSGGQQQRLCIARALTVEPEILLLDEPCSSLDVKNIENIERMLLEISNEYTILIATHNLAQAQRIANYTAFILNGELVEFAETDKIFTAPQDIRTKEYIAGLYG
ncbi:phosphate ABC transporter ATP-binding protein [Halocella sp. SP3-1]|nr:phosphate ABC transporter ATP-binding protein [Halocella sp. SP3-1]